MYCFKKSLKIPKVYNLEFINDEISDIGTNAQSNSEYDKANNKL
jgi:hypothetical protein